MKKTTTTFLHTESPVIHLQFMNVQMQAGGYDCGLFAVAFATALALGKSPCQFQGKMRNHLWKCFEQRKMEIFPYTISKGEPHNPLYKVCG